MKRGSVVGGPAGDGVEEEKEEQASSKVVGSAQHEQLGRATNSQRSLRTLGELQSNKEGAERVEEFLLRQSTEKPKLAMRRFEAAYHGDGQGASSTAARAQQAAHAEQKLLAQPSGAESGKEQGNTKMVLATPTRIIRAEHVQLLNEDHFDVLRGAQDNKQLLSPQMRHQLGGLKAGSFAGKPNALSQSKHLLDQMSSLPAEDHETPAA